MHIPALTLGQACVLGFKDVTGFSFLLKEVIDKDFFEKNLPWRDIDKITKTKIQQLLGSF